MPEFIYKAITKDGLIVRNKVESGSKQNLVNKLKNGNLTPIDIIQTRNKSKTKSKARRKNITDIDEVLKSVNSSAILQEKSTKNKNFFDKASNVISSQEKITTRDIMIFTQNFYLLKKADFNNIHALQTIIKSTENLSLKGIIEDILAGIEAGEYMYTTMEYYSDVFPYIYINMIKVGELSGSLTKSLQQAVQYLDSNFDVNKKLKSIIIPNLIQLIGLIVLLFVGSLYTVPAIQGVYDQVGTKEKLPGITIWFSKTLQWISTNWYFPTIIIAGIVIGIILYIKTPRGKYNFDYFKYTMPIFGKLFYTIDFSRLMRAMLLNIENGMRIQDALDVSKNIIDNYVMRSMIETSINNILIGASWIEPFEKVGLGSSMITEMLKVGMKTDLTEMMRKLLDYMDIDIKNIMDKIMAVLPQVVYSIVGIMLIFVVIVVIVPCIHVYMGTFLFSAAGV